MPARSGLCLQAGGATTGSAEPEGQRMGTGILRIQKSGGKTVAGHVTTLSVSWLNNRFTAVAFHRGVIDRTWECPQPVEGTQHFEDLIRQAVQNTGYRGQTVSLLLAHPRLVQQFIELPPTQGQSLNKLVARQAAQQKAFTGEAAFVYQVLPPGKDMQRIMLHLFPRILLNQLHQACRKNDLHLVSVVPVSGLLQHQITQNSADRDQVVLVAANTNGSTTMAVGNFEGQCFLVRTLPGDWAEGDRLAVDLNRTASFVNQQFGVTVGRIYLFGSGAEQRVQALQDLIQPPAALSPIEYDPLYWSTDAVAMRSGLYPNFLTTEQQQAPQRKLLAKIVAAATVLLLCATFAVAVYFTWQARQEMGNINKLTAEVTRLKARQQELQTRNAELNRKKEVSAIILDKRPEPVAAWFLAYLGEAAPSDLVITNLDLKRTGELWRLKIGGTFQPAAKNAPPTDTNRALAEFKDRLAGPPFNVRLFDPALSGTETNKPAALIAKRPPGTSFLEWVAKLAGTKTNPVVTPPLKTPVATVQLQEHFLIEGLMR